MAPTMKASLSLFILATVCGGGSSDCGLEYQGCSAGRDRRDIAFPGDDDYDINPITKYLTPDQIDQLNDIDSLDEIVRTFSNETIESPIVSARILPQFASPAVKPATPAKCKPILQPVPFKKPDDVTIIYWPYCVLLERCSGCCINDRQQSCQPTKTELVPFNDCNPLQEYSPRECRCNCGNTDEKRKCLSEPNKLWDNKDCRCRCREYPPEGCTTGLYFDLNTCVCTARPENRHRIVDNSYKLEKRRRRWQNRTSFPVDTPLT